MKKRFAIIVMLLTIAIGYFSSYGKTITYLAGNDDDEVYEWNNYGEEKPV